MPWQAQKLHPLYGLPSAGFSARGISTGWQIYTSSTLRSLGRWRLSAWDGLFPPTVSIDSLDIP